METFTLRRHRMVASSNRLCAELPNHRSGGRKSIITLVFSILIVSHDMFLVLTACPAPISDWFTLSVFAMVPLARFILVIISKHHSMFFNCLHCHVLVRACFERRHDRVIRECANCSILTNLFKAESLFLCVRRVKS